MTRSHLRRLVAVTCFAFSLAVPAAAGAADAVSAPEQLTFGNHYDRNPSVIVDGDDVWMFFARSQAPCDRLPVPGGDCDNVDYDVYARHSTDGGQTWESTRKILSKPATASPQFRGRTVAATQLADKSIHVFWASGGAGSEAYYFKDPQLGPADQLPTATLAASVMNIESVPDDQGDELLVYAELNGTGITRFTMTSGAVLFGGGTQIPNAFDKNLPKVLRDGGDYRMVMTGPGGDVFQNSSADGETWPDAGPTTAIDGEPTLPHWDPNVARHSDGRYLLFDAPDQSDGSQRIEYRTSTDFATWSAPTAMTDATEGSSGHWDYWPEPVVIDGELTVFYTSERTAGDTDQGVGHIYSSTITEEQPPGPAPVFDSDGDGIVDGSDCAPNDPAKPAENGADADCDGVVDPTPPQIVTVTETRIVTETRTEQIPVTIGPLQFSLCGSGTPAEDLIVCGAEANRISGLADDDRLFGGDGDDAINGGNGDDTIGGGGGADRLNGQNHDDTIDGGSGNDRISGGSGADSAIGGAGNDRITGGRGQDVVRAGSGKDVINVRDRRGGDVVSCGSSRDTVVYDRGDVISRDCERRLRRR